jgi:hypothetical protein
MGQLGCRHCQPFSTFFRHFFTFSRHFDGRQFVSRHRNVEPLNLSPPSGHFFWPILSVVEDHPKFCLLFSENEIGRKHCQEKTTDSMNFIEKRSKVDFLVSPPAPCRFDMICVTFLLSVNNNPKLPMAAWHSGHRNRRSRVRIPPGCKVFRNLYISVLLS